MPLFFNAVLRVELDKNKEDPKGHRIEKYSFETTNKVKEQIGSIIDGAMLIPVEGEDIPYPAHISLETIEFIAPKEGLDKLSIPLAELRMAIAKEMQSGTVKLPVSDLLELIRFVRRENKG